MSTVSESNPTDEPALTTERNGPETRSVIKCSDLASCAEFHLNNTVLNDMLSRRCDVGKYSAKMSSKARKVTFIHLPKAGGSSVRKFLADHVRTRLRKVRHEHYLVAASESPKNLLSVMMREPVSRAMSFYSYVRDMPKLHAAGYANKQWVHTFNLTDPVKWSEDPLIQRTLGQEPTRVCQFYSVCDAHGTGGAVPC